MLNKLPKISAEILQKVKTLPRTEVIFGSAAVITVLLLAAIFAAPNKTERISVAKQEISELSDKIRNHYKVRPDYWGLSTENAVKNKIIPPKMIRGNKIVGALGKELNVGQDEVGSMIMPGGKRFMITVANVGKSACKAVLPDNLSHAENPALVAVKLIAADKVYNFEWGGKLPLPIAAEQANKLCQNNNTIAWIYE